MTKLEINAPLPLPKLNKKGVVTPSAKRIWINDIAVFLAANPTSVKAVKMYAGLFEGEF